MEITPYVLTVTNNGDKIEKIKLFEAESTLYEANFGHSENIEFSLSPLAIPGQRIIDQYRDLLRRTIAQTFGVNRFSILTKSHTQLLERYSIFDFSPIGKPVELPPLFEKENLTNIEKENNQIVTNREIVIYGGTSIVYYQLPGVRLHFAFYGADEHGFAYDNRRIKAWK